MHARSGGPAPTASKVVPEAFSKRLGLSKICQSPPGITELEERSSEIQANVYGSLKGCVGGG